MNRLLYPFLASAWLAIASSAVAQAAPASADVLDRCSRELQVPTVRSGEEQTSSSFSLTRPGPEWLQLKGTMPTGGGAIFYLGVAHVTSPQPDLFALLEASFSSERPTRVYAEVNDVSYLQSLPAAASDVIAQRGEPSYLGFIARRANVPVLPLEPSAADLYRQVSEHYSADQLALAHILREVQIVRDRRRGFGEHLETVARRALEREQRLARQVGRSISFSNIYELTLAAGKLWPGLDWRQVPAEWSDPLRRSQDTSSRFINEIFTREKAIRDLHAFRLLAGELLNGERILVVAGRSHLETQVPALTCIAAANTNRPPP